MTVIVRRTAASAAFFDAAEADALLLSVCDDCGTARGPLDDACPECLAVDAHGLRARGDATLVSWSVIHRAMLPSLSTPYTVGLVELSEGPWILVRLIVAADAALHVGDRMTLVALAAPEGGEALIAAAPAGGAA